MKTKTRYVLILALIIAFNLLVLLILLPYAQQTANSHMNSGPFWGIVLIGLGLIALALVIRRFMKFRDSVELLLALVANGTVAYWVFQLNELHCEVCLNAG